MMRFVPHRILRALATGKVRPTGWRVGLLWLVLPLVIWACVPEHGWEGAVADFDHAARIILPILAIGLLGFLVGVYLLFRRHRQVQGEASARQASERRLGALVGQGLAGVAEIDLGGHLIDVNDRYSAIVGHPRADLLGRHLSEFAVPEDWPRNQALLDRLAAGGPPEIMEKRYRRLDGGQSTAHVSITLVRNEAGGAAGFLALVTDLTVQKETEEALRWTRNRLHALNANLELKVAERTAELVAAQAQIQETLKRVVRSEARFRTMFEEAPLGVALVESNSDRVESQAGLIIEANSRFAAIVDRPLEQIRGCDWMSLTHPEDVQAGLEQRARLKSGELSGFRMRKRYLRPDGSMVWANLTLVPVVAEAGQPPLHLCMIEDITDYKRLEQALADSEERYRLALDANRDGLWDTDLVIGTQVVNDHWYTQLGYAFEEVAPSYQLWKSHLHPDDAAAVQCALDTRFRGPENHYEKDYRIITRTGEVRWHHTVGQVVRRAADGAALRMLGTTADITAQREQEDELRSAKQAAEAANRAKSAFLAHMSHEIRTPMNAVLGLVQVLEQTTLDPDQRAMVRQVRAAGISLLGILNDILDLSKIEAGRLELEPRPFGLAPLLEAIDSLFGPMSRDKGIGLKIAAAPDLAAGFSPDLPGALMGDPLRLQQVLVNLIGNAIKFTEQGEVRVRIEPRDGAAETVRLRFVVSDTGIGMAPETLANLFNPFTQGDTGITRRFGGTGLGLAISKRLVELMGGEIGVESEPGEGSTFWFELPFTWTTDVPPPSCVLSREAEPTGPRLAGLHLLVVDDSAMNREVVERMLALEGARATLVADGQQAVEQLRAASACFDAVLMDVQMPVMDGLTATRLIRTELGLTKLPIVALTAGVLPEQQAAARAAGVDEVVLKPLDLERLLAALLAWVTPRPLAVADGRPLPSLVKPGGQASDQAFPDLPGIDRVRAAQTLEHDLDFFRHLLQRFADENAGVGAAARRDLAAGEREMAIRRMHTLKGNAGTLGAMEIMAVAAALEDALKQGTADLETGLTDLDEKITALITASAPWRNAAVTPGETHAETGTTAPALAPERLNALRVALASRDLDAMAEFEALEPALRDTLGAVPTEALGRAVRDLRFEEALALLEQTMVPDREY